MENTFIEIKSNGVVSAKQGSNGRSPYEHQRKAMECLDIIDKLDDYSTLVVLPTGGGKTYTASSWLLKAALNNMGERMTWNEIQEAYPDQWVELIEVKYHNDDGISIESAVVKYVNRPKSELTRRMLNDEIDAVYTTPDHVFQTGKFKGYGYI